MKKQRWRSSIAMLTALSLAGQACVDDGEVFLGDTTEALIAPPGAAGEVVFPRQYTDIQLGKGIRTVTSSRLPTSCIELPQGVTYSVTNKQWRSEGTALANQTELATRFSLDTNLSVAHGPASASLGMQAMRESEWSSLSMKLIIRATYTYDVLLNNPDAVTLDQASYDVIKAPAAGDTQALRDARARAFLKRCGRYWTKGVKKGAELVIVYSFRNTTRAQRESLTTTASGSVPATTTVGGSVTATQQQQFRQAIQNASLRVYANGFRIDQGDPLQPIAQAMNPQGQDQLASLTGFFNDIKTSVNESFETDGLEGINPTTSNVPAWKIALIGQTYQPLFRDPRAAGPAAAWAGNAQADLLTQDNALYTTVSQYTNFLRDARAAERTANAIRGLAANGDWNFPTNPEHDVPPLLTRLDTLRDTVRVAENATGPLPRNQGGGLNTDAQETGYWARRCWDLVEIGSEPDSCYAAAPYYATAVAALTAFRAGLPKPLNFFSVWWSYQVGFGWAGGPRPAEGTWSWANKVCTEHTDWRRTGPLGLRLPTEGEVDAFGAFLSATPEHLRGWPGMAFSSRRTWEQSRYIAWEWTAPGWTKWDHNGWRGGNPDYPWVCVRPAGPFAMPFIVF